MNWPRIIVFTLLVVGLAALVARRNAARGLPFWRTFFMAGIGFTGLGFLLVNIFGYLVSQ